MSAVGFRPSRGARLIIDAVDKPDHRPVWCLVWGGANTVAQAIWTVRHERDDEALQHSSLSCAYMTWQLKMMPVPGWPRLFQIYTSSEMCWLTRACQIDSVPPNGIILGAVVSR
ncbi:MAG: DUF1593 domain-containing protein [Saprospiraceae bacterium]|nr:DUF1593 domain-containing protein [Saprospiraceae bacterium]